VEYAVPDWQTLRTSAELPLHWGSLWEIEDDEFMSILLEKVEYALWAFFNMFDCALVQYNGPGYITI
jgi:hypothetical protein